MESILFQLQKHKFLMFLCVQVCVVFFSNLDRVQLPRHAADSLHSRHGHQVQGAERGQASVDGVMTGCS